MKIIVDSFAGGGGASTGIEMALGRSPDYAINHSADALAMHAVNHPATVHLDSNIWEVDPREVTKGRTIGLLWASPDCKHFSKAKGGKPLDRNIRDLAWVIVTKWIEGLPRNERPEVIILENVEEFRTWGPLYEDGRPIVELRGHTFEEWTRRIKKAGYRIEWRELRACDYGAPTIRKRFFAVMRRDGKPIVWPARTHGDPKKPEDARLIAKGKLLAYRTAAEIIDWSLPCPSIFDTSEAIMEKFGLRAVRPLADATMKRIARGVVRYVLEAKRPFIVRTDMASAAARDGVNSTEDPLRTQTTAGSHAVVVPSIVGCGGRAGQSAPRGGDEPTGTMTAKPDGCVVSAHLTKFQSGSTGSDLDAPAPTVTANSYVKRPGGAAPIGIAAVHLSRFTQNGVGSGADEPVDTVMAGAPKFGLVAASMVQMGYGEREGQPPRSLDIEKPLGTQVAGGNKHAVVAAFLAQHNNDRRRIGGVNPGRAADEPLATLTQAGAQQAVIAAHMMRQFGTSVGHDLDEPTHTDTATVNKSALISGFLTKYYGTGGQWSDLDDPMHTLSTKPRMGLVTVDIEGETYAIADIGMRMLTPRERFRAQGFPDSYIIDRRPDGSPISATVQGSCCGNSVCPPLAEALVAANCGDLAVDHAEAVA